MSRRLERDAVQQWEYLQVPVISQTIGQALTDMGQKGWELATSMPCMIGSQLAMEQAQQGFMLIFKRPIHGTNPSVQRNGIPERSGVSEAGGQ